MIGRNVSAALLVGAISFIVSHLVALAKLSILSGFGQGDLWPFAFWTVWFSASLGFGTFGLIRLSPSKRLTLFVALPSGLLFGLIWTLLVRLVLGPWFIAFSLPVLVSWTTGAAAGTVAGERFLRRAWIGAALLPSAVLALGVLLV